MGYLLDTFGNPPDCRTLDYLKWRNRMGNVMRGKVNLARTNAIYWAPETGDDGDDGTLPETNGSGSGPKETVGAVNTLIAATSGDAVVYIKRGEVSRQDTTALIVGVSNVTVKGYGAGAKPLLTTFFPAESVDAGGWVKDGANDSYIITADDANEVFCAVIREDSTLDWDADDVLHEVASAAVCASTPGSFYNDNAVVPGKFYVHMPDSAAPAVGEVLVSQNAQATLIDVGNVGGVVLDGVHTMGGGFDGSGSAKDTIEWDGQSTNWCVVIDCESAYGPEHVIAHSGAVGTAGGTFCVFDCITACTRYTSASGDSAINGYSPNGTNECLFNGNRARFGARPINITGNAWYTGQTRQGRHFYAHTGGTAMHLCIAWGNTADAVEHGIYVYSTFQPGNMPTKPDLQSASAAEIEVLRGFIHGDILPHGVADRQDANAAWNWASRGRIARIGCYYNVQIKTSAGNAIRNIGLTDDAGGVHYNNVMRLISDGFGANGKSSWFRDDDINGLTTGSMALYGSFWDFESGDVDTGVSFETFGEGNADAVKDHIRARGNTICLSSVAGNDTAGVNLRPCPCPSDTEPSADVSDIGDTQGDQWGGQDDNCYYGFITGDSDLGAPFGGPRLGYINAGTGSSTVGGYTTLTAQPVAASPTTIPRPTAEQRRKVDRDTKSFPEYDWYENPRPPKAAAWPVDEPYIIGGGLTARGGGPLVRRYARTTRGVGVF